MSTTCRKLVNSGLTIETWTSIDQKLTQYAQDVHYLINMPNELAMVMAFHKYGFAQPTDIGRKLLRQKDVRSLSVYGCMCAMAWHYGTTQTPWLLCLEQFQRYANLRNEQMVVPEVANMPPSYAPDTPLKKRHD